MLTAEPKQRLPAYVALPSCPSRSLPLLSTPKPKNTLVLDSLQLLAQALILQPYAQLHSPASNSPVCSKRPEQYPDTAGFSTEEWDNLQKNTAHLDPGDQRLVLRACLEQLITEERGQRWQQEGSCQVCSRHDPHPHAQ